MEADSMTTMPHRQGRFITFIDQNVEDQIVKFQIVRNQLKPTGQDLQ
jgi:hypothetical protein